MVTPIINDNPPDADAFMNAYGTNFNDTAQMIFNSDYIGFDSRLTSNSAPNLRNVFYSTFTSDDMAITGNIEYDSTKDYYWGPTEWVVSEFSVYDDFDNSSIDAKWTQFTAGDASQTIIESGTSIVLSCFNSGTATNTASITSNDGIFGQGYDSIMVFMDSIVQVGADTPNDLRLQVKIGTDIVYDLHTTGGASATKNNIQVWMVLIGDTIYYRSKEDTDAWTAWSSVAGSASDELSIVNTCLDNGGGTPTATTTVDYVRFNTFTTSLASTTDYITSSGETASSAVTK